MIKSGGSGFESETLSGFLDGPSCPGRFTGRRGCLRALSRTLPITSGDCQ